MIMLIILAAWLAGAVVVIVRTGEYFWASTSGRIVLAIGWPVIVLMLAWSLIVDLWSLIVDLSRLEDR